MCETDLLLKVVAVACRNDSEEEGEECSNQHHKPTKSVRTLPKRLVSSGFSAKVTGTTELSVHWDLQLT